MFHEHKKIQNLNHFYSIFKSIKFRVLQRMNNVNKDLVRQDLVESIVFWQ
jgi:hypothetical protein